MKDGVTHVRYLPAGARLEFRPGRHGGWASRYVSGRTGPGDTLHNFVYFGLVLPKDAIKVR